MVPGFMYLIAIFYKYNTWEVISLIATVDADSKKFRYSLFI